MEEDEIVEAPDLQEPAETTEPQGAVEPEEDLQALRDRAALADDLEAKNKQLFERAKKAEGFELVDGKWVKPAKAAPQSKPSEDLSGKDILALSSSGISDDEDIEFLKEAATLKKTSIGAVLKDPTVAALLKGKQEERQTAAASSTSSSRRMPTERTGRDLLNNAASGTLPEGKRDIQKLVRARIGVDK